MCLKQQTEKEVETAEYNKNLQAQIESMQDKMNQVKVALSLDGNEETAEKMTFHDLLTQQQMSAKAENVVTKFYKKKKSMVFIHSLFLQQSPPPQKKNGRFGPKFSNPRAQGGLYPS